MSAQHFREILVTVRMTKRVTQKQIQDVLGVSDHTIYNWKTYGVPLQKALGVGLVLREFIMEGM